MLCREQVAELRPHVEAIRAAGADLVIVGNGAPLFARAFREDMGLDAAGVTVLVDESLRTYRLLGFRRFYGPLSALRILKHGARAHEKGFKQGRTMGDALQAGGVVVVRPGGAVVYAYASAEPGDHPPPSDILAALGAVGGSGASANLGA